MTNVISSPEALADRLVFGFTAVLVGSGRRTLRRLISCLFKIGEVTTPSKRSAEGYAQVTLHLVTDDDQPAGELRIDLHLHLDGDNLVFGNRCSIQCNGLKMMRGVLGLSPDTASFDGTVNLIGSQHHTAEALQLQLGTLEEAAHYVLDALQAAFGESWLPGELWLKAGEACRDYSTADSVSDIRIVQHATMCGTVERRWDEYERLSCEERDGIPTLRFITHANGPEDKAYPKDAATLRLKACCPSRVKMNKLTGVRREKFSADGVRQLTLHFLIAASARLDQLERHVSIALGGEASTITLIIALRPLIERAWGGGKGHGPFSQVAAETAQSAINAFLSVGFFDAGGLHARHAIRRDLNGLTGPDGPLNKHVRRAVYYLKPQFARACAAIQFQDQC
ncbi:hypothetical protein [Sphingomonas rubra]|uniref:Uncharacterized protein n=1 Tax=Sphingomonas rubra TaxID=634430 RepID=A0A1I5S136_9SPHN|nr:hypothetical protein [Sphingomonas rubra]SFP64508.1 hypothetical protein SAMN04488241_104284 [Sphingomonas rubra]